MTDEPQVTSSPARPSAGSVRTFNCPSCGGAIDIRAAGITITAICKNCGAIIDVANDNLNIIQKAATKTRRTRLPIGARGTLFGTLWEIIGYTGNSDGSGNYLWGEYLLFNPYQGFRFLVEDAGHWNFVTMLRRFIAGAGTAHELWLDERHYRLFNRGDAIVQYVMGEFYWRVEIKDKSHVADYVSPPYMLSMEAVDGETVWSQAVYVEAEVIRQAFIPKGDMPTPKGVAANQPGPGGAYFKQMMQLATGFLALLLILQIVFSKVAGGELIYEKHMDVAPGMKGQAVITDPIEIPAGRGNLQILGHSYVNNNWVEIYGSLVNDTTQESDDFILPVEYYQGYDSDGNWSEGSHTASTILSRIQGGNYHLLVETDAGVFLRGEPADFDIKVIRNVPMWENFWIAALLLFAWPAWVMLRRWYFETQRWQNSDFPPAMYKKE